MLKKLLLGSYMQVLVVALLIAARGQMLTDDASNSLTSPVVESNEKIKVC